MMKYVRTAVWSAAAAFIAAPAVQAAPFEAGDVFASLVGTVEQFSSAGTLKDTLGTATSSFEGGSAFDSAGNLYVAESGGNLITQLSGPNDPHTPSIFAFQNGTPQSIVFDKAGDVFVSSADSGDIVKYSAAGTVLGSINTGTRANWIDLSADQKTLYFTTGGDSVSRIDFSTGTILSDFASGYGGLTGVSGADRLLGDGGLLLADGVDIKRFDSSGNVVQTYGGSFADAGTFFSLNLDPDGKSFWSGVQSDGLLYKFDIATGALEQTIDTGAGAFSLFGASVFGELTLGNGTEELPEPGTLLLFGAGLLAMTVLARRRRLSAV